MCKCTQQCAGITAAVIAVIVMLIYFDVTTPPRKVDNPDNMDPYVIEVYSDWKWEHVMEEYWGEHMHLGYWENPQNESWNAETMRANKIKIMEKHLAFGMDGASDRLKHIIAARSAHKPLQIFDAGCGIGGASRWLAKHFGDTTVNVTGVTITPYQVRRGTEWTQKTGVKNVRLLLGDLLKLNEIGINDASMDIVWSFESEHHIHKKDDMAKQYFRILKPGGLLILMSCNRRADPTLTDTENELMEYIESASSCPKWSTINEMRAYFTRAGFTGMATADFGPYVGPDWVISLYVGLFDWSNSIFARYLRGELWIPLSGIRSSIKDFYITYKWWVGYQGDHPVIQQGLVRATKP